jgi:hypothetical protein
MPMSYGDSAGQAQTHFLFPGRQGFLLLTTRLPKPTLATGGIWAGMMSPGQLGHGARAASTGRTQVGGHCRG